MNIDILYAGVSIRSQQLLYLRGDAGTAVGDVGSIFEYGCGLPCWQYLAAWLSVGCPVGTAGFTPFWPIWGNN